MNCTWTVLTHYPILKVPPLWCSHLGSCFGYSTIRHVNLFHLLILWRCDIHIILFNSYPLEKKIIFSSLLFILKTTKVYKFSSTMTITLKTKFIVSPWCCYEGGISFAAYSFLKKKKYLIKYFNCWPHSLAVYRHFVSPTVDKREWTLHNNNNKK